MGLQESLREAGLSGLGLALVYLLLVLSLCTFTHEFVHFLTARFLGCQAGIQKSNFFIGLTGAKCPGPKPSPEGPGNLRFAAIAASAPIAMFGVFLSLWFSAGENSLTRMAGLFALLYSALPSMAVWNPGTDFQKAVLNGFPLRFAVVIFLASAAVGSYLIAKEVLDRKPFA